MKNSKKLTFILSSIFMIVLVGALGIYIGYNFNNNSGADENPIAGSNTALEKSSENPKLSPITGKIAAQEPIIDPIDIEANDPDPGDSPLKTIGTQYEEQSSEIDIMATPTVSQDAYVAAVPDGDGDCCKTICKSKWDCLGHDWYGNIIHYTMWSSCIATDEYVCTTGMPDDTCDPEEPENTFYPGGDFLYCQRLWLCCNMWAYDCGGPDYPAYENMY